MAKNSTSKSTTERKKNSFDTVECASAMRIGVKYAGGIVVLKKLFGVYNGTIHNALNGKNIQRPTAKKLLEFLQLELKKHDENKRILRSEIDKLKQTI